MRPHGWKRRPQNEGELVFSHLSSGASGGRRLTFFLANYVHRRRFVPEWKRDIKQALANCIHLYGNAELIVAAILACYGDHIIRLPL